MEQKIGENCPLINAMGGSLFFGVGFIILCVCGSACVCVGCSDAPKIRERGNF